jgi:uncharacterized protein (DUF4415 family)
MPKTLAKKTTTVFHHEAGDTLSPKQKANLIQLITNPKRDEDIDLTDIPELPPDAVLVKYYRPRKVTVTMRLDADVLAWLKATGEGYQTRINELLRELMTTARSRPKASK